MTYDELLAKYGYIKTKEIDFSTVDPEEDLSGLYVDGRIYIRKDLPTTIEKACTFIEEVGHHYTSAGNILDQSKHENVKQERRARAWAYEEIITIDKLLQAFRAGIRNRYELADFLNVTELFLQEALDYYKVKYENYHTIDDYLICFDPLAIAQIER